MSDSKTADYTEMLEAENSYLKGQFRHYGIEMEALRVQVARLQKIRTDQAEIIKKYRNDRSRIMSEMCGPCFGRLS